MTKAAGGLTPAGSRSMLEAVMKKVLYIVSRGEQKLYNKFLKAYADSDTIEVILDRRQRQRRNTFDIARREERRRDDRRWHDVSKSLRAIGWAIVRRP
jgi:hypothetical protein